MLVRKYVIIAIATFVQSDISQLHLVLAVLIVALHLHDKQKPFGHGSVGGNAKMLHRFEMWSLLVLLFLQWSGIYFYISLTSGNGLCISDAGVCTLLVTLIIGSNAVYVIVVSIQCCSEWGKRNHVQHRLFTLASKFGLASSRSLGKRPMVSSQRMSAIPGIEMHVNPAHSSSGSAVALAQGRKMAPPQHSHQQAGSYTRHFTDAGDEFFVDEETGKSIWPSDMPKGHVNELQND